MSSSAHILGYVHNELWYVSEQKFELRQIEFVSLVSQWGVNWNQTGLIYSLYVHIIISVWIKHNAHNVILINDRLYAFVATVETV